MDVDPFGYLRCLFRGATTFRSLDEVITKLLTMAVLCRQFRAQKSGHDTEKQVSTTAKYKKKLQNMTVIWPLFGVSKQWPQKFSKL